MTENALPISDCSFNKISRAHEKTEEIHASAPNMSVEPENMFSEVSQKTFFSSSYNKQTKFIDLLAVKLEAAHHTIVRYTGCSYSGCLYCS